ncbi:MAG: serine hydrolase, partial [Sedimentisphaerales bacterium]|nr:serine hydrolase [Sedimentisphaerales bacterium]
MKKHVLWALLLAGIILAPQISSAMVFPAADWHERTPESQGVDSKKLNAALKYLESQSGFDGITETVVIRNGYMIWKGDNIDKKHSVASISKAFTSTCLGLLIDDGKCKLSDLAKKYEPRLDCKYPEYGRITIRHFANFTSGYDAVNPKNKGYGIKDPDDGSNTPLDPTTPVFEPGTMYSYFDDAMCMFGLVLTKIGQDSLYEIFRHRIADPIGVNPNQWDWTDIGEFDGFTINNAAGGINITARTLARFGHLILNHGNWNGKQLISKNWLDEAVKVQVPNTMKGRMDTSRQRVISVRAVGTYGYHWWANGILADGSRYFPDAPPGTFYRSGWPRQRLFIIPEWNMVIVRIGLDKHKTDRPANVRTCWNTVLKMVGKAITDTPTIAGKQLVPRISSAMVFPGADWKESKPEAQGVDTAKFDTAINYLGDQLAKRGGISELVIIRNGYMIHKGSNIDRKHCVASATKSFASTVLGHLIDKRKCSLDTLAKDYVSLLREKYPEVTL